MNLFLRAFLQVFLVAANTYLIAERNYIGIGICSFLVSYVWTFNVVKISIGNRRDKIIYAAGAMCGGLSGVFLTSFITNLVY